LNPCPEARPKTAGAEGREDLAVLGIVSPAVHAELADPAQLHLLLAADVEDATPRRPAPRREN
jgi:hypothetical protein